jgi:hypothetical protein
MMNKIHKKSWKILMIIALISATSIWNLTSNVYSQTQDKNTLTEQDKKSEIKKRNEENAKRIRKLIEENGDPIADFDAPEPTNPDERAVRKLRNGVYDFVPPNNHTTIPTLDKQRNEFSISSWTARFPQPPFPCSNLIAIGKVNDAKAFVSNDKINVYSEFNFQINKILKNNNIFLTQKKNQITLNRGGNKVRLPSGKIFTRLVDGLYMPKPDKEYLMFLEYEPKSQTYVIITGYQFKEGKVESLDGISLFERGIAEKYQNYPKYNGLDVKEFEKLVMESIVAQSKNCDTTKYTF